MPKVCVSTQLAPPYIRYFQIVRDVLEENIAVLVERSGKVRKEICQDVRAQVDQCMEEWFSGGVPAINYQNPLCRLAYLYEVVPAGANIIEHVFASDAELGGHFKKVHKEKGNVSICAFGGGPGTELLGVCKWAERTKPPKPIFLEYLLLDRISEWLDSWKGIKKQIESRFRRYISKERQDWPVVISGMFSAVDVSDSAGLVNKGMVFEQDICIISYLVSEVFANFEDLRSFTEQVADHAPKGAKFLFVDRREARWKEEIKRLAKQAGIKLSEFNGTRSSMDPRTEEASDLGTLPKELGVAPKLKWNAFWVVGTKK